LHLGFEGYRTVALDDMKKARVLSRALERCGYYTVLSEIHHSAIGQGGLVKKIKDEGDEGNIDVRDTLLLLSTTMPTDSNAIRIMSLVYQW
jgi:glutamate/tyrosine decarboxylase-like PLP-dependent enzyme